MGDFKTCRSDLAQIVRLALAEQSDDVRMLAARLVRRYRRTDPGLAEELDGYLRASSPRSRGTPLREAPSPAEPGLPLADESRLALLRSFDVGSLHDEPLLPVALREPLEQLVRERQHVDRLAARGLSPTRSAMFVGPPGVGKTVTARWLAHRLGLPLYVLDLTAVMSSLLGRSGGNLRTALDFAKRTPSVVLLDEFDAVGKRRGDEADIGELKRLVTVILQELDEWPDTGLLLAATNHPELIDPALWRRFDLVMTFEMPNSNQVAEAITRFLGEDAAAFGRWIDVLALTFAGESFSDIERELRRFRRALALETASATELVETHAAARARALDGPDRIALAVRLAQRGSLSQNRIAALTGVSRDTIRKHRRADPTATGQPVARAGASRQTAR